jgi:tetratricopeptide (TPR) repeat protein
MKKLQTILSLVIISALVLLTLFVYEIFPFAKTEPPKLDSEIATDFSSETIAAPTEQTNFLGHIEKGISAKNAGNFEIAIREFKAAYDLNPQSHLPFFHVGEIHLLQKNPKKAQANFLQALKLNPTDEPSSALLSQSLIDQDQFTEAAEIIKTLKSKSEIAIFYRGIGSILENSTTEAQKSFQQLASRENQSTYKNQSIKIIEAFNEFSAFEGSQEIHLKTLLARSFNQINQFQIAKKLLFEVIKSKNDYRDAWILLGYAYLKTDQNLEASDALEEALKIDPQKPETHFYLGMSYFARQDANKAAFHLEKAIEFGFEPRIQAEQKLAEIYEILGEFDKAAAKIEAVLALNDSDISYFVKGTWLYLDILKNSEKAISISQKSLAAHPQNPMSYNLLAWAQIENNQIENAKENLFRALELNPNFDAAYLNLGRLYEKEQMFTQAQNHYEKAAQLGNGNSISQVANESITNLNLLKNSTSANLLR